MSRKVYLALGVGVALTMVVGVCDVAAQEAAPVMPKYPVMNVMMHEVDPGHMLDYQELMAKFVAAAKQHEQGGQFVAYGSMTGGPKDGFYYIYPMEELSDMEEWTPPGAVVRQVYGAEEGTELLRQLGEITGGFSRWMSFHAANLANLDPETVDDPPPKYAYFMHVKVKAGLAPVYTATVAKMVAAHKKHENGMHWGAGVRFFGGDHGGPEYGFTISFDSFAEVDEWPDMMKILVDEYGEEEAKNIMSTASKLTKSEAHFLMMIPELSTMPMTEE
jgi:hypothetical protein